MGNSWCWVETRSVYYCNFKLSLFLSVKWHLFPQLSNKMCCYTPSTFLGEIWEKAWTPWLDWGGWARSTVADWGRIGIHQELTAKGDYDDWVPGKSQTAIEGVRLCKKVDRRAGTILYRLKGYNLSHAFNSVKTSRFKKKKNQSSGNLRLGGI